MLGSPDLQLASFQTLSSVAYAQIKRDFYIRDIGGAGVTTGVSYMSASTNASTDDGSSTISISSSALDFNVDQYILFTATPVSGVQFTMQGYIVELIKSS
jgi:hypothetical protein